MRSTIRKDGDAVNTYTGERVVARKNGKVVFLDIRAGSIIDKIGDWTLIDTLPVGMRPTTNVNTLIIDNNKNQSSTTAIALRVEANGQVRVWPYNANVNPCGSITFIVD